MTMALWLLLYGGALAWLAPAVLRRIAKGGVSPRMGVAAWLATVAATLTAWLAALVMSVRAATDSIRTGSVVTLCLELFGFSDHTPMAGRLGSIVLVGAGLLMCALVVLRLGRCLSRLRARSHEHANAARIIGRPTGHPNVVVVDADRPAAYCVVGRPNAIVVTSAAINSLGRLQLRAVLAHEDAHIAGRHHHILMVLRALAVTFPRLPLFVWAVDCVGELLEMCADDAAARRVGIHPLVTGLITLAGHRSPVQEGLAAAGTAVAFRTERLVTPVHPRVQWRQRISLAVAIATVLATPVLIQLLCHH